MKIRILLLAFLSFYLFSCSDDDDITVTEPLGDFENGFLISNQGPFNNGFGAVTFVDAGLTASQNNIFQTVNNDNLGNVVNGIGFTDEMAYIVANVGNRLTVVNRFTFEEVARIDTGFNNPRNFIAVGDKGYVSNWGDGFDTEDDYIAVIDLTTNTITTTISVPEGPEKLEVNGTDVYVAHQGGFGVNNIISVIDTTSDQVTETITVGDVPNSMQLDGQGNLWVLSAGSSAFTGTETGGSISVIDLALNEVSETFTFETTEHPSAFDIENDAVYYYLAGGIYQDDLVDFELTDTAILDGLNFFNMRVVENNILGVDAGDFASNGSLEVYDLTTLEMMNTLELGIVPDQIHIN